MEENKKGKVEFMHVEVSSNALAFTLYSLWNSGVRDMDICQEDNNLYIGIELNHLKNVVYNIKDEGEE